MGRSKSEDGMINHLTGQQAGLLGPESQAPPGGTPVQSVHFYESQETCK